MQAHFERRVAQRGGDDAGLRQHPQVAVGQGFQVGVAGAQVVAGAALRDQQAEGFLEGQRAARLVHLAAQQAVDFVEVAAVPDPHAVADAVHFAVARLGRQRHRVQVVHHDLAPHLGGVRAVLVGAQGGRDHLLQLVLHGAGSAFRRVAVLLDLRGQGAAAGGALAARHGADGFFQHRLAQAVPLDGRVTLRIGVVQQLAVLDEQQALHQRGGGFLEAGVDALRVAGAEQGLGAAVDDIQAGAGLLAVGGEDAHVGQLDHLGREARLRGHFVVARFQLAQVVRQVGVAQALVVWAVVREADRFAGAGFDLVVDLGGQFGEEAGLHGRGARFLQQPPDGQRQQHQQQQDEGVAGALALRLGRFGRVGAGSLRVQQHGGLRRRHHPQAAAAAQSEYCCACAQFAHGARNDKGPAETSIAWVA